MRHFVSPKPKAVYAARKWQYTAAGGEVQVPRVVLLLTEDQTRRWIDGLIS